MKSPCIIASLAGLLAFGAAASASASADLSGTWRPVAGNEVVRPADGTAPPLKPEALARHRANQTLREAALKAGDLSVRCLPTFPGMMRTPLPFQLLQRPELTLMVFEKNHAVRFVYMDEAPPEDPEPAFVGHSTGRWDGDVLVIETTAIKIAGAIDVSGLPHGDALKVTERLSLIDGGKLQNRMTLVDDETFTRPWDSIVVYERGVAADIVEDVCTLGTHRGAP